jgi:hypothetical protein
MRGGTAYTYKAWILIEARVDFHDVFKYKDDAEHKVNQERWGED